MAREGVITLRKGGKGHKEVFSAISRALEKKRDKIASLFLLAGGGGRREEEIDLKGVGKAGLPAILEKGKTNVSF